MTDLKNQTCNGKLAPMVLRKLFEILEIWPFSWKKSQSKSKKEFWCFYIFLLSKMLDLQTFNYLNFAITSLVFKIIWKYFFWWKACTFRILIGWVNILLILSFSRKKYNEVKKSKIYFLVWALKTVDSVRSRLLQRYFGPFTSFSLIMLGLRHLSV